MQRWAATSWRRRGWITWAGRCAAAWRRGTRRCRRAIRLLHDFNISTPCGSFSFGAGLINNLQGMLDPAGLIRGLQNTATSLIGAAISQLPMVSLCYAAPTMCDMVKYLQDLVNEILQAKGLSCAQAETLLVGVGARLSGARTSRCISAQQRAGMTLIQAEEACVGGTTVGIIDPATGNQVAAGDSASMIGGSLERVNAPQDILDFAQEVLGEIELKPGASPEEPLDVDITAPAKRLHDVYKTERDQLTAKIEDAVNIVGAGNVLTAAKYRDVSLPGMVMPNGVLQGMYDIRQVDPVAYQNYLGKMSGTFTMLKLSWRVSELEDLLEEGMLDNTQLSEAEADIIKARLERLSRERDRLIREKELAERHALPILQAVLQDIRQREGAAAGMAIASGVDAAMVVEPVRSAKLDGIRLLGGAAMRNADIRQRALWPSLWACVAVLFFPALALGADLGGIPDVDPGGVGLSVLRPGDAIGLAAVEFAAVAADHHSKQCRLAGVQAHDHGPTATSGRGGGLRR